MSDELTLRFERRGDPPNQISSAWLIDEGSAQYVANFVSLDDYTVSLDLAEVPSGRYWLSASISSHPILRFTIDIGGDADRSVRFSGRAPRCASVQTHCARRGPDRSRRVHTVNIGLPLEHSAVILVAGFDYHTHQGKPTDYTVFARQWRDDLYHGLTDAGETPNQKIERAIFDHTVVSTFDFATGDYREQIRGVKGWHGMYDCMCGTQRPHTANPHTDKALRESTDSMSITDVYAHINKIGKDAPGSLTQLHFFSHAFFKGPILLNTDDHVGSQSPERDPNDKDPRPKDFFKANRERWPHLVSAFAQGGLVKSWGCFTDEYIRARIKAVRHTKSADEQVDHEGSKISRSSVMMDVDDVVYASYVMACFDALGVGAWGAAPGTSADYERGYMYVNQSNYGSILRWYEKSFGGRRDLTGHFPIGKLKLNRKPEP